MCHKTLTATVMQVLFSQWMIGLSYYSVPFFHLCTMHFEIYVVCSQTIALFINLVKSFKFAFKYTIISLLHVSVFNDHHQGALAVPN